MKFHELKNTFKVNSVQIDTYHNKSISISDAFVFRTDRGFQTLFRFMDILKLFYNLGNSQIIMTFHDNNNRLILEKTLNIIDRYNEIKINSTFLKGYRGIGIFYIYQIPKKKSVSLRFSNRCYLGYKYDGKLSYVHGNSYVSGMEILTKKKIYGFVKKSLISNWKYSPQKNFSKYDYSEIIIVNPLDSKLNFFCCNKWYKLEKNCLININIKKEKKIDLISNCTLLRPLIFSYRKNYFDVHHA